MEKDERHEEAEEEWKEERREAGREGVKWSGRNEMSKKRKEVRTRK